MQSSAVGACREAAEAFLVEHFGLSNVAAIHESYVYAQRQSPGLKGLINLFIQMCEAIFRKSIAQDAPANC